MSDQQELLRRLVNEEEQAFKEMYRLAWRPIASYLRNHGGGEEDAKDIFQEGLIGFILLLRKPSFVATAKAKTIQFSICRNIFHKRLRTKGREIPVEQFPPGITPVELPDWEENNEQKHQDAWEKVGKALELVGGECKMLILKHYYEGVKVTDLASLLQVERNTLGVRLFRCMNKLRRILREKFNLEL